MRVTVRLFARLRELVGAGELAVEVPPGRRSRTCGPAWWRRIRPLRRTSVRCRAPVNLDYARMNAAVAEGDDVAFLPPVSGGSGVRGR